MRGEDPLGGAPVEALVQRGHHPVELGEQFLRHVDLAVRPDVRLDAFQHAERLQALVHLVDLPPLRLHPPLAEVVRVVGEREEAVAEVAGGPRHLLDRRPSVRRPVGVTVELAHEIPELHELREAAVARGAELARVLAQLRRDRLVAQEAVQAVLVGEPVDLARLDHGDAVLGDGEAASLCLLAERDVVVLRAREVLEQAAVVLRRHDAQVDAESLLRDDRRLRVAARGDLEHPGQGDEVGDERGRDRSPWR